MFSRIIVVCLCMTAAVCIDAQSPNPVSVDTLHLNRDSVQNIFVRKNLNLLAQRYNIDAQQALVEQARLFPNPTLSLNTNLYQTATRQFFPVGENGEIAGSLSQVIMLAGKHNKQLSMVLTSKQISVSQFDDLLRSLKHTLLSDFYNIHYLLKSCSVYQTEMNSMQKICDAFEVQKSKGNISEKELIRVKSQLYSLQSEYNDLCMQINGLQSELRLLMGEKKLFVYPIVNDSLIDALKADKYPLSYLLDNAYSTRPDLKIAALNAKYSLQNYQLQKALAVPDITLMLGYDQQGSFIHNMTTVGFAIDLPVLNRNQGAIRSAKSMVKINDLQYELSRQTVEEQIFSTLKNALETENVLRKRDTNFEKDYNRLASEVLRGYQTRTLSMLDFLDFYDSYKQNLIQVNTLKFNKVDALIDLGFYSGVDFFK